MLQSRRQGQWGTAEYDKAAIHGVNRRAYKALEVRNTNEYFKIYFGIISDSDKYNGICNDGH